MRDEDKIDKKEEEEKMKDDKTTPNVFANEKPKAGVYMNNIIRGGALVFLGLIMVYDKLLHQFIPPLPEHYYGYAVGIMLFGDKIVDIMSQLRK